MATTFMTGTPVQLHAGVARPRMSRNMRAVPRAYTTTERDTVEYTKTLPGICAPFNAPYFDPAGLSKTATVRDMRRWRESELVHGRVAMLAAVGFLVQENLEDYPVLLNFDGYVKGPAIYHFQQVEESRPLFWETLVLGIGLAEAYRIGVGWAPPIGEDFNQLKDNYQPGDLGFDPLGIKPDNPKDFKDMQTRELNNGRLAMIAVAGFVAQELVEQQGIFEHLAKGVEKEVLETPTV